MNSWFKRKRSLKRERNHRPKKAIKLLKEYGFKNCRFIGGGTFGDVIKCKDPVSGSKVAVKVVATELSSWGERIAWGHFHHLNIVPLLSMIHLNLFDLFVMPFYSKTLHEWLKTKRFRRKKSAYDISRSFLGDILSGLEYLHNSDICHLDLKTNNVLITSENNAVISDFSATSSTKKRIHWFGLPHYFRPPETCIFSPKSSNIDGIAFDIWSFGILTLHVCEGKWFMNHIAKIGYSWNEHVYPVLFHCLQLQTFFKHLRSSFPRADVSDNQILEALNLVQATLRYKPEDRPQVSILLRHSMINKHVQSTLLETFSLGFRPLLETDPIWSNELDYYYLM